MSIHTKADRISGEQRHMLDFVFPWLDFGGGSSEEIFVRFGVGEHVFFERLHALASGTDVIRSEHTRRKVLDICRRRIAVGEFS